RPGTKYDFIGKWKPFAVLSALLFGLGLLGYVKGWVFHRTGFNYSVEFRGGTELNIDFVKDVDVNLVRKGLEKVASGAPDVVKVGDSLNPYRYLVRMRSVSAIDGKQAIS